MKKKIAIVRGKYLNKYEMQSYEPLVEKYDITAFGSHTSFHSSFAFPVKTLFSPLDLPDFPYKMPILNRLYTDAQYLYGLEDALTGFDIAHTAETYFNLTHQALRAKEKGFVKKVVITEWENISFNNEGIHRRHALKQYAIAHADHIIAVSTMAKKVLIEEGCDERKISIIHPGVDTELFSPGKKNENHVLTNAAVNKQKTNSKLSLLFVGRLVKNKGIYELLFAFSVLKSDRELQGIPIQLVVVGSGSEKERFIQLAKKLGVIDSIVFAKVPYEEMPSLYRRSTIFIAPSKNDRYWQEQWGMALMEAQASGLPIITTNSGSIQENVGNAAILVSPGNSRELADAIKDLITKRDKRLSLGKKARERAVKFHDCRIAAKRIGEVYERVLLGARG